jgi:hypothetical protein
MASTTVEQELIELETEYWLAIKKGDAEAAMELTDDVCIVTGAQGTTLLKREDFAEMMNSDAWTIDAFEIGSDVQVRLLTNDTAVIGYTVREKLTVEGEPVEFTAADTSTWVRRNGHWVCAMHTESILGDPFGRDKQ